jgi:hypothetical protein
MEFFIKQGATLPLLKMQFFEDGKSSMDDFNSLVENSAIYFSMKNAETGVYKFLNKPAGITTKTFIEPNAKVEYYIYYKFSSSDTNKVGRYEGEFLIVSDDGTAILPITEKLYINIGEKFVINGLLY